MLYANSKCTYREVIKNDIHGYIFTGKCIMTKKEVSVFVPGAELYAYHQGKLIQDALKSVSVEDREFLMSGMSAEAWKETFNDMED